MRFLDEFAALLAREFTGLYREDLNALVGSRADRELASLVDRLARAELHQAPACPLFVEKSVGFVVGLHLESGERVVLKLFHPDQQRSELAACHRVLRRLLASGFPATKPLTDVFTATENLLGCFYAFSSGELRSGHEPAVRQQLAATLAAFTAVVRDVSPDQLPPAPGHQAHVWQTSHRSFLNVQPATDLQWIDDIAVAAQNVLKESYLPLMPAHMDWGVKNARFSESSVVVAYDWDSLCQACEAEMVGRAAAQFTAQWDLPGAIAPSPDEALAFVDAYEVAASRHFDPEEWLVLRAAAEYVTAQVARLEASGPEPPTGGFLERLRHLPQTPIFAHHA